jgi:hypothetical protein
VLSEVFLSTATEPAGTQRARREISRATLRGIGDLRPAERHVEAFFENLPALTEPVGLRDAGTPMTCAPSGPDALVDH